jgi:hypothetical protein
MGNETNRRATAAEKAKQALELRRAGWSYDDIAEEVGYANRSVAYKAVKRAIAAITRESATELLELELTRLDDMFSGLYEAARAGDNFSVDRALKIMEQRAKLLGLYDRKTDDTTAEARAAIAGFREGLKGLFGLDDTYGQVTDGSEHVPVDGEPGA